VPVIVEPDSGTLDRSNESVNVYVRVHGVEQFWNGKSSFLVIARDLRLIRLIEVEAIPRIPDAPTLTQLDNTLRMFVTFCAAYHGLYHLPARSWRG